MADFAIRKLEDLPSLTDEDVDWRPVQHFFGLTSFGVNVYRATKVGAELIGEHDELAGGHEELYVVLAGEVVFTVDTHEELCGPGTLVAVRNPALRRSAVAASADAAVLAIGNVPSEDFTSTWDAHHFDGVPTVGD